MERLTIHIEVNPVNDAPMVDAGLDRNITEGESITLEANATDSDGTIVAYSWRENNNPIGDTSIVTLESNLSVGVHNFVVAVIDNDGAVASDSVVVNVKALVKSSLSGQILDNQGAFIAGAKVELITGETF